VPVGNDHLGVLELPSSAIVRSQAVEEWGPIGCGTGEDAP